ncbi:MAG: putative manganese-dependent inorganic diphosphatase [Acidobacteriota bacterium]
MFAKPVIVIGHKNPDLDSVASAVAYARFKQISGDNYIAATAGEVNRESRFVLDKMAIDIPPVIPDVKARVEDLLDEDPCPTLRPNCSLYDVGMIIRESSNKTLPIVDAANRLLGLVTIGDLAMTFLSHLGPQTDSQQAGENVQVVLKSPVSSIMKEANLIVFDKDDTVDEAKQSMLKSRFRNYPVIDEDNRFVGMISRYHLLKMKRKRIVLVDHNESKQAVEGVEEAELLAVIDHHRVGDIQTVDPILFRNEPVGATSTLVTEIYRSNNIDPDKGIAGLLLSGILSDTMIFRSPTTTDRDRRAAKWLSELSGLAIEEWGRKIFIEASPLNVTDPGAMIIEDLKEFSYGDIVFAVAQIETADMEGLSSLKESLKAGVDQVSGVRGYDMMMLMITDIFKEVTVMIVGGPDAAVAGRIFGDSTSREFSLPGVMSRKKQVVPMIYRALAQNDMAF